jgi:Uma2 family endonuclease
MAGRRFSAGDGATGESASDLGGAARRSDRIPPPLPPALQKSKRGSPDPTATTSFYDDSFYIADPAVSCRPYRQGEQLVPDPILIVEILPPGTERHDRLTKVPAYRDIATVEEILLIDTESCLAEVLRREGPHWITEPVRGRDAVLRLASIDLAVPMAELYLGIGSDDARIAEQPHG